MSEDVDTTTTTPADDELAAARVEIERLQAETANAIAEAAQARDQLAAAEALAAARECDADDLRAQVEAERAQTRDAVARYVERVLADEPSLPPELVRGDTIADVDTAIEAARAVVGRVRSLSEARSQAAGAPAGAPARAAPDLSALSAEQKIRYGLRRRGDA